MMTLSLYVNAFYHSTQLDPHHEASEEQIATTD